MKIGTISYKKLPITADYLQLDISGLDKTEVIKKYNNYNINIPVILHGDWEKSGYNCVNDILEDKRQKEYIDIINSMKEITNVLGFTIHPPSRNRTNIEEFIKILNNIKDKTKIDIFIENRSNKRFLFSTIEEIMWLSNNYTTTIDIPQLYITCEYNYNKLLKVLNSLNKVNIKELHLANVKKTEKNTFVGRKINDGLLDIKEILTNFTKVNYITLEILSLNSKTFLDMKNMIIEN